jgi:hypothetical protein
MVNGIRSAAEVRCSKEDLCIVRKSQE